MRSVTLSRTGVWGWLVSVFEKKKIVCNLYLTLLKRRIRGRVHTREDLFFVHRRDRSFRPISIIETRFASSTSGCTFFLFKRPLLLRLLSSRFFWTLKRADIHIRRLNRERSKRTLQKEKVDKNNQSRRQIENSSRNRPYRNALKIRSRDVDSFIWILKFSAKTICAC